MGLLDWLTDRRARGERTAAKHEPAPNSHKRAIDQATDRTEPAAAPEPFNALPTDTECTAPATESACIATTSVANATVPSRNTASLEELEHIACAVESAEAARRAVLGIRDEQTL